MYAGVNTGVDGLDMDVDVAGDGYVLDMNAMDVYELVVDVNMLDMLDVVLDVLDAKLLDLDVALLDVDILDVKCECAECEGGIMC